MCRPPEGIKGAKGVRAEEVSRTAAPPAVRFTALYRYASRKDAALLAVGGACVLVSGCNQPLQLIIFGRILDSFNADPDEVRAKIHFLAMVYALLGLQQLATNSLQTSCFATVAARIARRTREQYYAALLHRCRARLDLEDAGAHAASVLEATSVLQAGLGDELVKVVQQGLAFVLGIAAALVFAWRQCG